MLAARNSRIDSSNETVKILLEHGANVNLQNKDGYTALMSAAQYSKTSSSNETVKILLEYGANKNMKNIDNKSAEDVSEMDSTIELIKNYRYPIINKNYNLLPQRTQLNLKMIHLINNRLGRQICRDNILNVIYPYL